MKGMDYALPNIALILRKRSLHEGGTKRIH
jgi:hypothetical protein